jgi:hypothetical protein
VFLGEGQPCRLDYSVVCADNWRTRSGRVAGWIGDKIIDVSVRADGAGRWWLNEIERPAVAGCIDLDLNFIPCTNLLPIRRLGLAVGADAQVRAAWLRFPSFAVEPLDQYYPRSERMAYRYESSDEALVADLRVNAAGFVVDYPPFWVLEEAAEAGCT